MIQINYYDRIQLRSLNESEDSEDAELHIQIVPAYEADAATGRISVDAPVARAVLHRHIGETVNVRAQGQTIPMRIVTIEKHESSA
ncbi:transcription elongation factor GreA/transcription elongation factor GreB [Prosthecobacter fusiformis]|uniref:Transcription elongation factor GreA/transcription elongation factor GreB n=1 Tax=Prosthecobacter fusiformis TaxID=48464 RepID=A0A4R7SQ76_9BACT|nr:GreA/GreB family elongation factor [Prosthecobacter fusiformis]TDU81390.1 transcription elongation factor GreA/transcription elongation factor GreB [Prosthecobacter fusiformis]